MTIKVSNIYCVGINYLEHARELNNAVPQAPLIFSKPTHAYIEANGQAIELPSGRGEVHYEAELVLHISRDYQAGMAVDELVDLMAIGLDITLRDVQREHKKIGYPWLAAKGFPNSAVLGSWLPFPGVANLADKDFSLLKNGVEVQRGNVRNMIFNLQQILDFIAANHGLGQGDIVFTGTPVGVGALADGDELILRWGDEQVGSCKVKF